MMALQTTLSTSKVVQLHASQTAEGEILSLLLCCHPSAASMCSHVARVGLNTDRFSTLNTA